ncbi:hypothetical protein DAEQUDRAFT_811874 [Daedalea quercina L-15889]|uniref:Protein BNI4 n=1 Tax=Daedalea quercina L-15889 TaxID=1314783 RepID=A0A165PZN3_9APHY|nr:hypothetical protein DAEQUDRAFT_811874 [Daedalea quercina L-15889]
MAVLVSQDWQPLKDHTMDALPSQSSSVNPSVPRQRSSPANDQQPPNPMSNQQPYPYPVQQQQAGWSPAHSPQQYYPAFYQNQPSYPIHGHTPHPSQQQMHAQNPYYDPANAQYAQWAYQQMMFNAQQAHQMSHVPQHMGSQRGRSAPSGDYFAINQLPGFNPFPSGTPPPHPSQLPNGGYPPSNDGQQAHSPQYQGFHPYRRPPRQGSSIQDPGSNGEWRPPPQAGPFQPPYVRADAAGSSTSINSSSSHSGSQRQRTNSNQSSPASPPPAHHVKPSSGSSHPRGGSASSPVPSPPSSLASSSQRAHGRTSSTSSTSSSTPRMSTTSSSTTASHGATLRKPSPLSQGNFTATEKRMSRDDSDLAAMLEPSPSAPGVRSGGLKGRLRRALSLGANNTLHEEDEDEDDLPKGSSRAAPTGSIAGSTQAMVSGDDESTATVQKKKSRSLFNSRLNRSTDNISLSSTMSSASMVIRKLGNIGKLTRRNSLAGITSLFKDKKDKEDEESDGKKSKKKKGEKGAVADPSVSMATAELDRSEYGGPELAGLSPAARLARQHTLKSNAEAAAKAKAEAEARAAAAAAATAAQNGEQTDVPMTWEKNTTNRQGDAGGSRRVNEEGMGIVDDNSDSGSDEGPQDRHPQSYSMDGWDDDEDWNEAQEEEDVTIRADFENATLEDDMEPWAVNVRRSVEKTRKPAKGILKNGQGYEQDARLQPESPFARVRSNSYDSAPRNGEPGPLAHIPSPDPDHIDGLHKHNSHSPPNGQAGANNDVFIPPLSFESNGLLLESPKEVTDTSSINSGSTEKGLFSHPNSSAPALSTMLASHPPTLSQRSATAPAKRLSFASNLSVYDTFPATVYDRRSEPATWSRLTPALAQRIKEELNSYKMEEMEVHAASRVHTQFFV